MRSNTTDKQIRIETFVYITVWALLFVAPILMEAYRLESGEADSFDWYFIGRSCQRFIPFLLLFILHNCLLAPLLIRRKKQALYLAGVAAVVALFAMYECNRRPQPHDGIPVGPPPMEGRFAEGGQPCNRDFPPFEEGRRQRPPRKVGRPPGLGSPELTSIVMLVLLFAMNLGIKSYFKQRNDEQRMAELERSNLEQKLAYLRYQVNPHFLMNTLNNIHALVDIDPEGAQTAIVELSRMLRYLLYDGDHQMVALQQEVDFLSHYVALMRLRYNEAVDIRVEKPAPLPLADIPPLLLATFVENAFKHGVSYQHHSFVHIQLQVADGRLRFSCSNSKRVLATQNPNQESGVGLKNARQRLDLLFADNYMLDIQDAEDTYTVHLDIPLTNPSV